MSHPENSGKGLELCCPTCAEFLGAASSSTFECSNKHQFTLAALLLGQSIQAGTMFRSGMILLEQQVKLIRAVALEHSITHPDKFLALENQADKLEAILVSVREALKKQDQ